MAKNYAGEYIKNYILKRSLKIKKSGNLVRLTEKHINLILSLNGFNNAIDENGLEIINKYRTGKFICFVMNRKDLKLNSIYFLIKKSLYLNYIDKELKKNKLFNNINSGDYFDVIYIEADPLLTTKEKKLLDTTDNIIVRLDFINKIDVNYNTYFFI